MTPTANVLLLSTADWDAPLWTNKQYMACELAKDHRVTYVDSIGLRRPELTARDARRIFRRLVKAHPAGGARAEPPRPKPERLVVRSPLAVPHHRGLTRAVNKSVLLAASRSWRSSPSATRILWTYSPETYGLHTYAPTVYHCVDLLQHFPRIDPRVIERGERALAETGALGIASSEAVAEHLTRRGFSDVRLWPNVADVAPFVRHSQPPNDRDRSLVVFGGNLSPHKFDCDLIRALKQRLPDTRVVLAGPVADGGGREWEQLGHLRDLGVEMPGRLSLAELASLYGGAVVGVIPYLRNPYTRGVMPLKVNEYLGAGLAVVSSALESLAEADEDVITCATVESFVVEVERRLAVPTQDEINRRTERALANSWETRGQQARLLVAEMMGK